ncbi:MAG: subclass B1 metallo-beta-lactamase [Bacteroidetes bacterium GWA2_31_9]|nr:MAG: subclass B1 metallo-beta-lactamase [Bacteroidetes bacterium GWA2_31_9]
MKSFYFLFFLLSSMSLSIYANSDTVYVNSDIVLIRISDSVFVHITYDENKQYGRFSSNGLIIIKNKEAVIIDTPMDNEKTEILCKYINEKLEVEIKKLIIGHFHNDCLGGLEYMQKTNIESIANSLTIMKCKELNLPIPSTSFTDSLSFDFNGLKIECRFLGGGHTFDNIVVWIDNYKILFGGCLIKSTQSKGLGNTEDAVISEWGNTVLKVMKKYSDAKIVIPGHGNIGNYESLKHTLDLLERN